MRHRFSFLCIIFLLCLFSNSASAQLDPEVNKPYPLNVVLHFSKHRILTPVFQNQVQQHLADLLRTNFGKLAEVKVVRTNPLITKIKENGLQSVLDGFDRLTKIKTQYVLIDFQDGEYQIRTRQHDGWTGLASPMVRRAATKDRSQIVRRIADLIDREFGISGTVTQVNGPTVKVNLRGGSLKNSLDQWIEPGDVFAVCRIHRQGPKYHSQQLEWAYLIVNAVFPQGYCHCRFVYRYEEDQLNDLPGVVGYRCLLLPTGQGPLSLQLIGAENSSVDGLQVHAGQEGFNQPVAQVALNSDGIVRSSKIFDKIAYVRVLSGSRPVAQFAVPIIPGRTYTSRIHVNPDVLSQSQIQLRYDRWLRRMYDDLSIAGDRVALLNQKLAESPEAALGHAKRGLKNLSGELRNLALEKMQLQTAAREKKIDLEFSEGKQRLQELKDLRTKLAGFIGRLEKMIKEAKSEETKKIKTLITQAGLLEGQAKYAEAIRLYQQILAIKELPEVQKHLNQLKKAWETKQPIHKEARLFIYDVWPEKMDTVQLKEKIKLANKYFQTCKKFGDRLSPKRMLTANMTHMVYLTKRMEILKKGVLNEDNKAEVKTIQSILQELPDLHNEIRAWVAPKSKE